MTSRARNRWSVWLAVAIVAAAACTPPGRSLGRRFFASLRLAKPQPVSANPAAVPVTSSNRQLQDAIGAMVSSKVNVPTDEADRPVPSVEAARQLAGFAVQLPRARHDSATVSVLGERTIETTVDRNEVQTILMEAGQTRGTVPASVQGAPLSIRVLRAVRVQYGNCPLPAANTIQGQINGPPPPSTDNGDCLALIEGRRAEAAVPAGLALSQLVDVALQLSGMSPNQTRAMQGLLDPPSAIVLSLPRGMRSYDMVSVHGSPAMLINTGGRRGPTWALVWTKNDMVFQLAGYGASSDAVAIAESVS
jgi:hypothetical protein